MNSTIKWKHWLRSGLFISALGALTLLQACKCDDMSNPECPNYDPCYNYDGHFADFGIEERFFDFARFRYFNISDSAVAENFFRFSVFSRQCDSVKWKVGNALIKEMDKSVEVWIGVGTGAIDVTAIVYNSSVVECGLNEDGIDTLTKSIELIPWWQAPYFGDFVGYHEDDPQHIFTITLDSLTYPHTGYEPARNHATVISNLPDGYSYSTEPSYLDLLFIKSRNSYNGFTISGTDILTGVVGEYDKKNKILTISYTWHPPDGGDSFKRKFIGVKI